MAEGSEEFDMEDPGVEVRVIGAPKGKGLFATKAFKNGEVIFEERPLVCCQFAWNAVYGYLACEYCMRPLEGAEENARRLSGKLDLTLPYPQCCSTKKYLHVKCSFCGVGYCSTQCREQAWNQYHKTLCLRSHIPDPTHPLEQLNEAWKPMHYPPETACIMLLARMIAIIQQAEDKEGAMHLFMQFCHQTINEEEEIAHKLLGAQFVSQLEILRELMSQAMYSKDVHNWLTPEGFQSVVALVGTNGQGVGTSALSEWVKNCSALKLGAQEKQKLDLFIDQLYDDLEKEAGGFLNNEGSALYSLQSSCNHSCEPNAVPSFPYSNFHMVMCATRDIAAGEEICVSYLSECVLSRSRHSRNKILRENYLFTCNCPRCEAQLNDPDVSSEDEDTEDSDSDVCAEDKSEDGDGRDVTGG